MARDSSERRLAAIVFTDIVGYTALMERDEEAGRRARDRHEAVVRPLVERYGGQWIERSGDETLSSFPSALDAVNCALAAQAELDGDPDLKLRIGVHHGDVTFDDAGVSGDGVNVAARVRPLAKPGGICVTGDVRHSVRGRSSLAFESLGEQSFKNVDHPVAVYAVTGTAAPPARVTKPRATSSRRSARAASVVALAALALGVGWWLSRTPPALSPIRSLAVLPLDNLSDDPEHEHFADGMTEALIGGLAKLGGLRVISRTSVMGYKGDRRRVAEIARELDVDGIIEGTVMRDGGRVRITAQLIDARDDRHLWADHYDRQVRDVFALQSDVARAVVEQIRLELTPEERAGLEQTRSVDPRAYDAYVRGIQVSGPLPRVDVWGPKAIAEFERAVELDPSFAEAYAALSRARVQLATASGTPGRYRSLLAEAREASLRALEIDESLGAAWAMLGTVRMWSDWDLAAAGDDMRRAVTLGPSDPLALLGYAQFLMYTARPEEALEATERLVRVAPLDPSFRDDRIKSWVYARQYQRALEEIERARELDPGFDDVMVPVTYLQLGRFEEAHRAFLESDDRCGEPCGWSRDARERGWSEGGWQGSLRNYIRAAAAQDGVSPYWIASHAIRLGDADEEVFAWLERSYRERDPFLVMLQGDPVFDPVRDDPRFDDLLRRLNGAS